jgi:vitamin B12 transporter
MNRTTLAVLAALAATPAPAQDIELAEIVVTALRTAIDRLRTGVSVSVLGQGDLAPAAGQTAAGALARLPGVSLAASGPFGNPAALRIRGADARYLAVFVDGIRVSDPSGTTVSFDFGALPSADIGRIEVLRGSQSALWGGSAVGGVIALETRAPAEDGTTQTVTAEAGSYGTARLSYGITRRDDRAELAFTATALRTDGFSAASAGTEPDGAEALRLSFSARYALTDTLTLGGALFTQRTVQDYDGYTPAFVLGDADNVQTRTETGARVFAQIAAGATSHTLDATLYDIARAFDQEGALSAFDGRRLTLGWQATTELSPALTLVYGADVSREEAAYSNLPGGVADTTIAGAFLQALWAPSADFDLSAAVRLDRNSAFGTFPTGRLAASWRPGLGTTLRAALATGFRAPSIDERFGDYPGFFPFVGNPNLTPEESLSAEIGIEQALGGGTLSVTAFRLETDNLITYVFGAPATLENLAGTSVRQGVEIAADLPLSDRVTLGLAYTYTDARRPTGARLTQVPYHLLNLSLGGDLTDRLSADLSLTHAAGRLDNDANTFAVVEMPDYTVLNAGLTYDVTDATQAYLRVENLTDEVYEQVNGYATARRSVFLGLEARF